jgi:hypothetical protein
VVLENRDGGSQARAGWRSPCFPFWNAGWKGTVKGMPGRLKREKIFGHNISCVLVLLCIGSREKPWNDLLSVYKKFSGFISWGTKKIKRIAAHGAADLVTGRAIPAE